MRFLPLAAAVALLAAPVLAAEPEVIGGDWLIVDGPDARGRAPFNTRRSAATGCRPPRLPRDVIATRRVARWG